MNYTLDEQMHAVKVAKMLTSDQQREILNDVMASLAALKIMEEHKLVNSILTATLKGPVEFRQPEGGMLRVVVTDQLKGNTTNIAVPVSDALHNLSKSVDEAFKLNNMNYGI